MNIRIYKDCSLIAVFDKVQRIVVDGWGSLNITTNGFTINYPKMVDEKENFDWYEIGDR